MSILYHTRFLLISVALILGMTVVITVGARKPLTNQATSELALLLAPPPRYIQELITTAAIIVVGSVTASIEEGPFVGYEQNGKIFNSARVTTELSNLPLQTAWRIDFAITPTRVLKGSP